MDKDKVLDEIFNSDPLNILNVKPKSSGVKSPDDRLKDSYKEITDFIDKNGREPEPNTANIHEYQLYTRLKHLKENPDKLMVLEDKADYGILKTEKKELSSIDDILDDDSLNILEDEADDIFKFKHTPKDYERASTDFVARRKPCKDFDKYEEIFKVVQKDLREGNRKLIPFMEDNLREGDFYVHNGILMFLAKVDLTQEEQTFSSGKRVRKDGRTVCIFENGTESNMLYRSVAKALYANGQVITKNINKVNEEFIEKFSDINPDDEEAGYIYILKSKSTNEGIASIENLYKIGFSKTDVEERVKNAEHEPTYLMASVKIEGAWKCYNMNTQKFEQLIHNFFGNSCLELDVFDDKGKRHTPREWFIVPLDVIEQAIELIINGKIVEYKYDPDNQVIVGK